MLLDQPRQQRDQIHAACRRYGARRIRVFGSAPSDDLLKQHQPLAGCLAEMAEYRLDIIPEYKLNRHIRAAAPQKICRQACRKHA